MEKSRFCLAFTAVLFCLTGCNETLYSPAITQFTTAYDTATKTLGDAASKMNAVKRQKLVEAQFYKAKAGDPDPNVDATRLNAFATLVCAESDFLNQQRQALATLGLYNSVLKSTNATPKQDIPSLYSSIVSNWKDSSSQSLKPPEIQPSTTKACVVEVTGLINLPQNYVPEATAIAGISTFVSAASDFVTALKTVAVDALSLADDAVRAAKIKAYVSNATTQAQVSSALATLNANDTTTQALCDKLADPVSGKWQAPCDTTGKKFASALDGVTIATKWAALRKPWHLYLAMYATKAAYLSKLSDTSIDNGPYYYLMDKQQADLAAALTEYYSIIANPTTGDIGRAMASANDTLVMVASGNITPEQALGVLSDFASRVQKIDADLTAEKAKEAALAAQYQALGK